jgi:hypothetical protein
MPIKSAKADAVKTPEVTPDASSPQAMASNAIVIPSSITPEAPTNLERRIKELQEKLEPERLL